MTATALTDFPSAAPARGLAVAAGRLLTLAGAVFTLANLFQYGVESGRLPSYHAPLAFTWVLAMIAFCFSLARLRRSEDPHTRRVDVWARRTVSLMVVVPLGLAAASTVTGDWGLMRWTSTATLGLYAIAWAVAWIRTRSFNMAAIAGVALAGAAGLIPLIGTPDQYLVLAATLAVTALAPGLWLIAGRRL